MSEAVEIFDKGIEVVWNWPFNQCVSSDNREFLVALDKWCNEQFKHYIPTVEENNNEEWFINVDDLSSPERTKVWNWIESQGLTNGEA